MTRYIAAYDTETPKCPAACEKIVRVHREFEMPATFYVVGRHLRDHADHYRRLLNDPLFETRASSSGGRGWFPGIDGRRETTRLGQGRLCRLRWTRVQAQRGFACRPAVGF